MAPLRGGPCGMLDRHHIHLTLKGFHMHIFETFNGFTVVLLLLLAGAWLALLAYEGKL